MAFVLALRAVVSTLAVVGANAAVHSLKNLDRQTSAHLLPNGFVVELDSQTHQFTSGASKRESGSSVHEEFYGHLRKRGTVFEVRKEFDSPGLFTGTSLLLEDASEIEELAKIPGVVAVRPITVIAAPNPHRIVVNSIQDAAVPPDAQSTHKLMNVDKLHQEGIKGKGVTIGIIDTGIDYSHPSLGGKLGPGNKVIGGYDFVGDDYTGRNAGKPDSDPLDQCNGHGTHVAGIIAADAGNDFGISGVAPEASLMSYRVFGCTGSSNDDVIIEALLRGAADKVDILTLSLGGVDGWTESTGAVIASRLSASGTVVTIACGNDGDAGSWYSASPGNAIDSISVASLDNTHFNVQNATVSGDVVGNPIQYNSLRPFTVGETPLEVYATSNSTTVADDACNALPASTPDLANKVVIVRRGTCSFVQKLTNIAAKGAKAFLIYNNIQGLQSIEVGTFVGSAALITDEAGAWLVSQLAAGKKITLTFPTKGGSSTFADPNGGLISNFTTYGPTYDMYFKPAVTAPGGNVLSTLPVKLGSWGVQSGTSMAAPNVAGASALVLSVRGKTKETALALRDFLQSTAVPVSASRSDAGPFQTLSQQGAGLVNVHAAARTKTVVTPAQLTLNDTSNFKDTHTIKIMNTGTESKTFKLTHVPAGTMESVAPGTIFAAVGPVPLTKQYASATLSESSVTVAAGQSASVTVKFTPPAGVDTKTYPVYSGWVEIAAADETLRVAYMGVAASLKSKQILDNTDAFFGVSLPLVLDRDGEPQEGPTNYTFAGSDFPSLLFRLVFGTARLSIDLVPATMTVKAINDAAQEQLRKRGDTISGFVPDSVSPIHVQNTQQGNYDALTSFGPLAQFNYLPRNTEDDTNGYNFIPIYPAAFANGTKIPNGQYKFLYRALKIGGNPTVLADYESYLGPIVGVNVR